MRVEHAHSAGVSDDRVEVHLAHLGMRGHELGNRGDEAVEGGVHRWPIAKAFGDLNRAGATAKMR